MKLRFKLNLISVGVCLLGAFICSICGNLVFALVNLFLGYLNWITALKSEDNKEDD